MSTAPIGMDTPFQIQVDYWNLVETPISCLSSFARERWNTGFSLVFCGRRPSAGKPTKRVVSKLMLGSQQPAKCGPVWH